MNLFQIALITFSAAFAQDCKEVVFEQEIRVRYIGALGVDSKLKNSLYDCALHCAKYADCAAANYDQVGSICILFDKVGTNIPKGSGRHGDRRSSHWRNYDRSRRGLNEEFATTADGYVYLHNIQCKEWDRNTFIHSSTVAPFERKAPEVPKRQCNLRELNFKDEENRMEYAPLLAVVENIGWKARCAQECYRLVLCTEANYLPKQRECELMSAWLENATAQGWSEEVPTDSSVEQQEDVYYISNISCDGDERSQNRFLDVILKFIYWLTNAQPSYPGFQGGFPSFGSSNFGTINRPISPYFGGGGNSPFGVPNFGGNFGKQPISTSTNYPINVQPSIPISGGPSKRTCGVPTITPRVTEFSMRSAVEMGEFRIVGGTEARPHSWPWQAGILFLGRHICGGSLVSDRHILTAAHCVHKNQIPTNYKVVLGTHVKSGTREHKFDVNGLVFHPSYNKPRHAFDVAVLRLARPVTFDANINSICLTQQDTIPGTQCVTSGWGATKGSGDGTRLQQVVIPIMANAVCNDVKHYFGQIHSSMLCAGYDDGGKDSCQGDSGGPLVCPSGENRWSQHGIVSWGFGCGQRFKPGVYTRITEVNNWISQQIKF